MSKAHDPHWRYIAFRLTAATPLSRRAVGQAIVRQFRRSNVDGDQPNLTRYEWPHGIIKVHHFQVDAAMTAMGALDSAMDAATPVSVRAETLRTSGTIKALTNKIGVLQRRT